MTPDQLPSRVGGLCSFQRRSGGAGGIKEMRDYPYMLFIPAVFISLTMLSLQLIGDGLRDATDPKLRQ